MAAPSTDPLFFASPEELRSWFKENHATAAEIWLGYHKKNSGHASVTWPESLDEALCVGWIDGIRKSIDRQSYKIRFTPRRRGSIWSAVNIRRAVALTSKGRMTPAGRKAFAARKENKSGIYSYEQRRAELPEPGEKILRRNPAAWKFFQARPPSYRKMMSWWIASAKREETRRARLARLIAASAEGRSLH
ncbi:MAG TPA: YdeI/OmpD-associated family protein [Chthoniobacterales bacterium]|jgi:uncharacterized protein YdeI (YjbR/CyaY-like superfamily)